MNSEQAFALWDALGSRINEWTGRLTGMRRRILEDMTAISVEWIEEDAN